MKNLKLFSIALLVGALAGTFYDSIHAYYNVLYYTHPHFWKMSAIVPVEFGLGAVAFIANLKFMPKITSKLPDIGLGRIIVSAILLFVAYMITGIYAGDNQTTLLLLLPFVFITLWLHRNKHQLMHIGMLTIIGPVMEIIISSTGFFYYTYASPIPYWLPVLWTVAAGLFLDFGVLLIRKLAD